MATPGFDDPALAAHPSGGNLYYAADQAVGALNPGEMGPDSGPSPGLATGVTTNMPVVLENPLMFGGGAMTGEGQKIVHAGESSRGHWSEILNFHGSPAPWVLIGILIVAGLLHLQAKGSVAGGMRL